MSNERSIVNRIQNSQINKNVKTVNNNGHVYNSCDFSKKTIINIYNNIINTARSFSDSGIGSGLPYDRIILMSLFVQNEWHLTNMRGYIKRITSKNTTSKVYIGNVFKDDLYISNHLVIKISNDYVIKYGLKKGMFIQFNGDVCRYDANNNDPSCGYKFGINNFELIKILSYEKNKVIKFLEALSENNDGEDIEIICNTEPRNGYFYFLKYIMSMIQIKMTRIQNKLIPIDFFTNMILSMHFSEKIEKYILVNQSDYNYLVDNAQILCPPFSLVLFLLDELKIYDPYSILCILTKYYNNMMTPMVRSISKINDINEGELVDNLTRYLLSIDFNISIETENLLYDKASKYSSKLLHDYNNLI